MIRVMVLGATGGIGQRVCAQLTEPKYHVMALGRNQIDLGAVDSAAQMSYTLTEYQPDWIINCAGVFVDNHADHKNVFDVNVGSNWNIIKHYLQNPPSTAVKIAMLGSNAYQSGRKNYMLYAASKAALHNLWQGAVENFQETNVSIGIMHFGPVATSMIQNLSTAKQLDPDYIASHIIDFCDNMTHSQLFEMENTK